MRWPAADGNRLGLHSRDAGGRPAAPSLSSILVQIADNATTARITVADLVAAMQDRAIAALIFVFAVPNAIPLPPGASSILGAPLLFLTAQLALGRQPWLPKFIAGRSLDREHYVALVKRVAPWLARAERLLKPRLRAFAAPPMEYAIGGICFLLAVILFLPIPMGNMPPAIAICMFALAILEHDGIWVIAGLIMTVGAIALIWGVLFALVKSGLYLLTKTFG